MERVLKELEVERRERSNLGKTCSFEGCANDAWCKGLCGMHYQQARRGIPLRPKRGPAKRAVITASTRVTPAEVAALSELGGGSVYLGLRKLIDDLMKRAVER